MDHLDNNFIKEGRPLSLSLGEVYLNTNEDHFLAFGLGLSVVNFNEGMRGNDLVKGRGPRRIIKGELTPKPKKTMGKQRASILQKMMR